MSSMEAALVLTAVPAAMSDRPGRTARNTLRTRQALALNIGGVFVCERRVVLYRLEGEAEDIDRFLAALPPEADEFLLAVIDRWAAPRRRRLRRRLREAVLIGGEREWMRRHLAAPRIDVGLIRLFTLWLALRGAERDMGLGLDFTASLDRFPGSSPG